MTRIEVELEAITALLLHREPRGEAEWRAAALRGLMRWWFRAVVGAALTEDQVKRREDELFGTSERSSRIIVRVVPSGGQANQRFDINPGSSRSGQSVGVRPGQKAKVLLLSAPYGSAAERESALRSAYASLWLAVHLGSIGQRSRRGAGSLRMRVVEGGDGLPQPVDKSTLGDLATGLASGIRAARELLGADALRPDLRSPAGYPILHPQVAEVRCAEFTAASGQAAPETAARLTIMNVRRNLESHKVSQPKENEFGRIGRNERLASPTWVRVAKLEPRGGFLVGSVFRHQAAGNADWQNAVRFLESFGPSAKVGLSGR